MRGRLNMLKSKNQGVVFGVLTFVFGGIIILFIFNYKSVIDFIYGNEHHQRSWAAAPVSFISSLSIKLPPIP